MLLPLAPLALLLLNLPNLPHSKAFWSPPTSKFQIERNMNTCLPSVRFYLSLLSLKNG